MFGIRRISIRTMLLMLMVLSFGCIAPLLADTNPVTWPQQLNLITNAVMAKDVKGDTFDPVGITDTFPADQKIFHTVVSITNAPVNTTFKTIWLTSGNDKMADSQLVSDGTRNLDFYFTPNAGTLPAGDYKVQIFVNGALNRTLTYSVASQDNTQTTQTAEESNIPVSYVNRVILAKDTQGDALEPVDPTAVFSPTAIIHAIVSIQNAPQNTKVKAVWYVVDVGGILSPNAQIDTDEVSTVGSRNIDFELKPNSSFPAGTYRVEISVNGSPDTIKLFSVR